MNRSTHPDGPVLQAYHDGELDAARSAPIEAHCRDCARCRDALAELVRLDGLLADVETPDAPRPMWPRVAAARRADERGRLGPAFAFSTAAVCAAGITLGLLIGPLDTDTDSSADGTDWAGPSLWSGGASVSLLDIHLSDQD